MLCYEQKPLCELDADLTDRWEHLIVQADVNISMHPNWMIAIAGIKGLLDEIIVFLAWNKAELVEAIPYYCTEAKWYGLPLNFIVLAGNLICSHHEIVARGAHRASMEALLTENAGWDVLRMENVLSQSATEAAFSRLGKDIGSALVVRSGESSPYIPIQKTWDSFLSGKSAHFRSEGKRKEKKLRQLGELKTVWFTSEEQVPQLLADILVVEKNSWKEGSGMAISKDQAEHHYYQRLLPFLAQRDLLYANARLSRWPTHRVQPLLRLQREGGSVEDLMIIA